MRNENVDTFFTVLTAWKRQLLGSQILKWK